ncbi:tRNA-uridine aminocarboxypropyltransferase [Polaromonas sp. CG_9.11]|uniref:tRNA-uridine aminocarboxypropyltransferase n=1 Tax=Polaromonas sp. CG_9.11 TaxID=2787730 RepID=UPI0018C93ABF|nr:tRNA-uridine aminocarboxypropyltransferase [Polaromonas sp. CG_9.11]MBG6077219.1 DTW domain-containing protein YfiP [Polaromonas sp. CG_9.11]
MTPSRIRRLACTTCLRPQSACICCWVTPVEQAVEVLILQHPLEVDNPKGSARLLHLSLPRSRLVTGEVFDLPALLADLPGTRNASGSPKHNLLLYPQTPQNQPPGIAPLELAPGAVDDPARLRLVVLDGTWRKSRKMLYSNPLLQQLPRLTLQDVGASHYLIRKAHRPDQLSTLEATCAALAQLHGDAGLLQPLLGAFNNFVTQHMGYRTLRSTGSNHIPNN